MVAQMDTVPTTEVPSLSTIAAQNLIDSVKEQKAEGIVQYQNGNYQAATFLFQNAAELLENSEVIDHDLLANCYQKTALSCSRLEWYDLAETFSFKSIQYAKDLESPICLVLDYATLGDIYHKQGQYEKALSYYDSCLQIDRRLNDTVYIANDLSAIGRINTQIGREQEGLQQLKMAVSLTNPTQHPRAHCLGLNALGLGYLNCKDYKNAEKNILASLQLSEIMRDTDLIINRSINLGDLHNKAGNINKAEQYLKKSLSLLNDHFQPHKYTVIYRNLGEVYRQKGLYKKAITYYQSALTIAEEKALLPEIRLIYQQLQGLNKEQGNYQKAYAYADKFQSLSDSIFSMNARIRADIFNNQFALAKKEQAIQTLHFTNELKEKDVQALQIQRRWLLFSLFLGILLSAVSFYAFRQRQLNILRQKETKISQQLEEIKYLRKDIAVALAENERKILTANLTFDEINQFIPDPLSEREFEILQLLIQGKNNKEIAEKVFLSVNTIKFHLKNIYTKLEVKNRIQAIQLSLKK